VRSPPEHPAMRFGVFELDTRGEELRKNGVKLKLQEQPFRVLAVLLEHPGEIVTREELRERLWPDDTFVDFDNSLNTAVNKLREVLGDSAAAPRFVETVPRRGYRFVAPVTPPPGAIEEPAGFSDPDSVARRLRLQRNILVAVLGIVLGVTVITQFRPREPQPPLRVRRFAFAPEEGADSPVISPDGRRIAYLTGVGKQSILWVQDLDQERPRLIPGVEGAARPFWSADSTTIGFFTTEELRLISIAGGAAQTICRLPRRSSFVSGTWSRDGESIIFGDVPNIYEVAARGGTPKVLIDVPPGGDIEHVEEPHLLTRQNGRRALLFMLKRLGKPHQIAVQSLETGERRVVEMPGLNHGFPAYSPTGHIVYYAYAEGRGVVLEALPFSLKSLRPTGDAFPIQGQGTDLSVAEDGTLVYLENSRLIATNQLVWRDRNGEKLGEIPQPGKWFSQFAISRDAGLLIVNDWKSGIWFYDLVRSAIHRPPFDLKFYYRPVLKPDASAAAFAVPRHGNLDIYIQPLQGSLNEKPAVATALDEVPSDWSSDGKFLAYEVVDPNNSNDIWYLSQRDDGSYESKPFLQTHSLEHQASFSPDSRFLAYASDESGRSEVYIQPFPEGGYKLQVSFDGGELPKWSRDGKELFYLGGEMLVAAALETKPHLSVVSSRPLFNYMEHYNAPDTYEVSADGKRFLMVETAADAPKPVIRVVQTLYGVMSDQAGP
jgi:eukaryotic-like serine/threonine-protein kinase